MYSMNGMSTALGEITLVLFTTLAPAGVMALILMALPSILGRVSAKERTSIDRCLWIPLLVALVGLVISSTHLGSPANALYVLAGVGRSPLSNEVCAGVVFLGMAGAYWLTAFSERPHVKLRRIALGLTALAGLVFVNAIAFAYDADTIISWHTPFVPVSLWLNALIGGSLLALFSLKAAEYRAIEGKAGRILLALAMGGTIANVVVYALQGIALSTLENHMTTATAQVPAYFVMMALFALLCVVAILLDLVPALRRRPLSLPRPAVAYLLASAGIFVMRFAFYMSHLTVGLGV